jgi:SpoIID/LytB domain protein
VVVAGLLVPILPAALPAHADTPTSVVIDGHGWGHGVGMSQWGAYGYAVDHGWSADQILDHYYGGTVAATTDVTSVAVRMLLHDDRQTAVVNDLGTLVVDGVAGGPWRSVVARETAPSSYTVWARADQISCPADGSDLGAAAGWTVVATDVSPSVTIRTQTDTSTATDYKALVALCEPDGKVRSYRGYIRAVNGTVGENRTVNVVPLEQYLRSVIAKEMSPSWANAGGGRGAQALRAQAVAARSYALAENRYSYARTCDLTYCQAYFGAALRSSTTGAYVAVEHPLTDAAVVATAGQVRRVGSASGPIAYAMFSASSGGYTAPSTLPFPAVPDLGDATAGNPNSSWTMTIPVATIEAKYPSIGAYTGLTVTARNGLGDWGGRVSSVRVSGTAGSVTVTGDQLRIALGLKSNWFNPRSAELAPTPTPSPTPSPSPAPAPADRCGSRVPPAVAALADVPAARFVPLQPRRLVDTREPGAGGPLLAGCTLVIDAGLGDTATAVAVNVTAVDAQSSSYVTTYPCGVERPYASGVQSLARRIVAGSATVPLGVDGQFCVYSNTTTHIVVDLFGAYDAGSGDRFEPMPPTRRFDSRPAGRILPARSVVRVPVVGQGGAPSGATAAILTVHGLSAAADGFVTVYPCDTPRPWVSSVNVARGGSAANQVQVALGAGGDVCVYVDVAMHVAVDLSGWFGAAATTEFQALTPVRVADSRTGQGFARRLTASSNPAVRVAGAAGVPADARSVVATVTAVDPTATGFITVHPCSTPVPDLSMVRYSAAGNVANVVAGTVDATGRWCVSPSTTVDVIVDISGYFR